MGRCVSCVGKLGLISRCSTAANTPGSINFNPWSNDDSKLCKYAYVASAAIDRLGNLFILFFSSERI